MSFEPQDDNSIEGAFKAKQVDFTDVNIQTNGARIQNADLKNVTMRGVEIVDTTISGEIQHLVINGIDVAPLVEAELDRRHPERPKFRPTTRSS